jgi:hypothetical protein
VFGEDEISDDEGSITEKGNTRCHLKYQMGYLKKRNRKIKLAITGCTVKNSCADVTFGSSFSSVCEFFGYKITEVDEKRPAIEKVAAFLHLFNGLNLETHDGINKFLAKFQLPFYADKNHKIEFVRLGLQQMIHDFTPFRIGIVEGAHRMVASQYCLFGKKVDDEYPQQFSSTSRSPPQGSPVFQDVTFNLLMLKKTPDQFQPEHLKPFKKVSKQIATDISRSYVSGEDVFIQKLLDFVHKRLQNNKKVKCYPKEYFIHDRRFETNISEDDLEKNSYIIKKVM